MRRISYRLLMGATLVMGVGGIAEPVRAQDEAEPAAPEGPVLVTPDEQRKSFELWVFGPDGEEGARERLKAGLLRKIERIDDLFRLTPEQKKKLELAGQGDIKRFLNHHQEQWEAAHLGGQLGVVMEWRKASLMVQSYPQNLFDDGSLFAKTLAKTLTPGQRAGAAETERLTTYRTRVNWVLFPLDNELGLSREQHRRLLDVIAKETHPLKKYGELDDDAILLQASRLPEAKLRPIFDAAQWRRLGDHFDRARRMENILVERGYTARGRN